MKTVLVTGANGQLGQAIQAVAQRYSELSFLFEGRETLDVTNEEEEYKLSNFAKRVSPSGKEIYSLILEDKINSRETYQLRYLLKKDDDFALSLYSHLELILGFDLQQY